MTTDHAIVTFASFGLCALLAWDLADERERRIAAEEQLAALHRAVEQRCERKPKARLVTTINANAHGFARWCGHIRTIIEEPQIEWEQAQ